ncbi:hypothetical protein [Flavisolibacter tropicus]|uniref:Uncharacterized protein n=1 Tax=Flavisolibacter tropicus TaxID=1492898 RepID=A0A172U045_9BACT|nr:hypothetical protein [Flavisolibacter tropicus]ANE52725.1 hypothetical protein SY85_21855 [Flavisolibacter tropicus]
MKKLVIGIIILLLIGFAVKEFISLRKPTIEPEVSGYKFYYYPKLNVYYDATQNNFVYTIDGGMTWQTKKPTSPDLPEKLSQKVTIYSPDPDIWTHNSEHRQQYKGVSTNYVQRIDDTTQLNAPLFWRIQIPDYLKHLKTAPRKQRQKKKRNQIPGLTA